MRNAAGILSVWLFSGLLVSTASAEAPSCVSVCAEKTRDCAARCAALPGGESESCELACGRALLVSCVVECQATNVVVWDDYEVAAAPDGADRED
jgi:hypothetical protein